VAVIAAACGRSGSTAGGGTTSTTAAAPSATSADFGTLTDVCQKGSPSGSPTQGVTPESIHVAVFSDAGFVGRPGLNQEFFDTADVFSKWCNERGGINGRTIVVDKRDAALSNVQARMVESCRDDFVMVAGGATFDQDGVDTRLKCLLPDFAGFVTSPKARGADLVVQPLPNPLGKLQIGILNYLGTKYPDARDHVGVLTGDIATTKIVAADNATAAKSLGWKISYNDVYPVVGMTDWTPYAQKIKDSGTKGLIWVGEPEGLGGLMGALRDIGYKLDFVRADANHYDRKLIDTGGTALADKNVYVSSAFYPFEQAKPTNATGEYLRLFEQYKPGGKSRTYLGLQAWSAWLLFAKAAASCGNDLTRTCVYDAAKKITAWTGGGLHAETSPGTTGATECYALERATPSGFVLVTDTKPNQGIYNCSPKNLHTLAPDPSNVTTLADVGQSIGNMK
jgi:ABC-type branched-subunit amino acid transport system substrate-binding protein